MKEQSRRGSRNLAHFDAALVGYTFAILFATFAIACRCAMWLRPSTRTDWVRRQVFFSPRYLAHNIRNWFARVIGDFALNRFIFRRDRPRGLAHWLLFDFIWIAYAAWTPTFVMVRRR